MSEHCGRSCDAESENDMDNDMYDGEDDGAESKPMDPPPFSPPEDMRRHYLERRRNELTDLREKARNKDWRLVMKSVHNVRGSGAMYGFPGIGEAAAKLDFALQENSADVEALLESYVETVEQAFV